MSHSGNTMTTRPLISIYMPTWNRQQLAIRAIKSVLRQDYDHWELIVVDDCSSSWEQLQQFVTDLNDPRVVYTHNAINSGACAVRNQAIMQANGQYLTGIDDDDVITGVDVRSEFRLMLAAKTACHFAGDTAENLIRRVNHVPFARHLFGFCGKRLHDRSKN